MQCLSSSRYNFLPIEVQGRGDLVVRSRPRGPEGRRFETRLHRRSAVYGACCTLNLTQCPNALPLRGSLERGCQLRRRPRHLTAAQNFDVRPRIALVLLQNGTLI
ncbi:hypothetical protein AVEN_166746-1 [Araneus ventricosus]|uniref:Uncharacterized protein n=1 Tax=Araneus ventricosus TaxID=182803 RepID=A0A4Y2BPZ3_ARAVE|nr:hypothetical protein AVEN_166746-1 [Araneus ventricosus]